ncbi:hypothetical protein ACTNEO_03530 [Gracilibacillus sp. HCP3S3_G5_1]|uniref:hypothetical protein n=1 Tax=unclassified Gracilibacillus TaxID=2625209 RepID=UPI003F894356
MRKRSIVGMVGAAGLATTLSILLMDKPKRKKFAKKWEDWKNSISTSKSTLPIEEAGNPSQDNIENAKMVAEGSQFGVNYYNKVKQ